MESRVLVSHGGDPFGKFLIFPDIALLLRLYSLPAGMIEYENMVVANCKVPKID